MAVSSLVFHPSLIAGKGRPIYVQGRKKDLERGSYGVVIAGGGGGGEGG